MRVPLWLKGNQALGLMDTNANQPLKNFRSYTALHSKLRSGPLVMLRGVTWHNATSGMRRRNCEGPLSELSQTEACCGWLSNELEARRGPQVCKPKAEVCPCRPVAIFLILFPWRAQLLPRVPNQSGPQNLIHKPAQPFSASLCCPLRTSFIGSQIRRWPKTDRNRNLQGKLRADF